MSKCQSIQRVMVAVLTLLHVLTTITFIVNWLATSIAFVNNNQSFWTNYIFCNAATDGKLALVAAITSTICTILAELTIVCVSTIKFHLKLYIQFYNL